MKKVLSLILAVILMATLVGNISAAVIDPGDTVAPCWGYMSDIGIDFNFSGTSGTATATINRLYGGTTLLEGALTVYEKVGTR